MSFTKVKTSLWFMFTLFSTEARGLAYFVIMSFNQFFVLFWKFVKNDNMFSFLRIFD